jgi:hypothetical protein
VKRDLRIQWQLFAGVALFVAIIDAVYWFVSYERAGTTMLTLTSGLSAFCAAWLFIQDRRGDEHDSSEQESLAEPYLPTASWWPLVIGLGAALALNGLILSWPYALPGAAVMSVGLAGFVKDTRRRT